MVEKVEQRVTFSNYGEFLKTKSDLAELSEDELDLWLSENNKYSLLSYLENSDVVDNYLSGLPKVYLALFNSNSEMGIGDKVVWLHEGNLYSFEETDDIEALKINFSSLEPTGSITISSQLLSGNDISSKATLGGNSVDARYQREFRGSSKVDCSGKKSNMGSSNYTYKYIHELKTVKIRDGFTVVAELYLNIKMEYKYKNRSWKSAGEKRDINVAVQFPNITFKNAGRTIPINKVSTHYKNYTCSNNQEIRLAYTPQSYDVYYNPDSPQWEVSGSGTITHKIHGGYNSWTNYVNW
ncbi:hypothetical protein ACU8V7_11100 [Zobellia nedashkovskayae]